MSDTFTSTTKRIKQGLEDIGDNCETIFSSLSLVTIVIAAIPGLGELAVVIYGLSMLLLAAAMLLNLWWELYLIVPRIRFRWPKSLSKFFFQPLLSVDRYEEFQSALWEMREDLRGQGYSSWSIRLTLLYQKIGMLRYILKEKIQSFVASLKKANPH